jgi:hypothetical protein
MRIVNDAVGHCVIRGLSFDALHTFCTFLRYAGVVTLDEEIGHGYICLAVGCDGTDLEKGLVGAWDYLYRGVCAVCGVCGGGVRGLLEVAAQKTPSSTDSTTISEA